VAAALRLGARWVEIDVQLSSDFVPVVYHDPKLRRVSGQRGDVRKMTWAQLKKLSAYEPRRFGPKFRKEKISSLAQLAQTFKKLGAKAHLFVELKEESLKPFGRLEMLAAVHKALEPIRSRCILISFDEEVLRLARQYTKYPVGLVLRRLRQTRSEFWRRVKPEFVFSSDRMLPKSGRLRFGPAKLAIYEVPEREKGLALLRRGASLIETFEIGNYV